MYLVRVLAAAAAVVACALAPAMADGQPKWGAHVDVEGRLGTDRSLGELDLFLPLMQSARTLLFTDVRGRADDEGSHEGNFGLGLRHMLASGWNIGAYGYYDRRRTDLDNYFDQATFGLEALGRDFDFRANAYLPFGAREKDAGSTAGGSSSAAIVGTTIEVTTLGGTLREERALQGFDAEVGWRVPIWSANDNKALRLYAGMFRFDDSVVEAITGPRLRAELTMYEVPYLPEASRLTLGAEFLDDDVRGSQGFAIARLRIPLQPEHSERRPNWQERRMVDYVQRDIDIVTEKHSVKAPDVVETATATAGGEALTVINSDTTTGAALPAAIADAGANSFVVLAGTFATSTTTTLQAGQTVMGAGSFTVQTASGRTATVTTPGATIDFTTASFIRPYGVVMADNSTLQGLTISATTTATGMGAGIIAVLAEYRSGLMIADNTISAHAPGGAATVVALVGSSGTVSGNDLSAFSAPVAMGQTNYASALFTNTGTYTVSGNTFNASGQDTTRALNLQNGTTFNAGSDGNTLASGGCFFTTFLANVGSIGLAGGATCPH